MDEEYYCATLQAMLDVAADQGWLNTSLNVVTVLQMVVQGRWHTDPLLSCLPFVDAHIANILRSVSIVRIFSNG
jgi:activating signal cointegrator complex subunit 3